MTVHLYLTIGYSVSQGWDRLARYKFACTGEWSDFVKRNKREPKPASSSRSEITCIPCLKILRERKSREVQEIADKIQRLSEL